MKSGAVRSRFGGGQAGSLTLELVVWVPLIVIGLLTLVALGSIGYGRQLADAASAAASRAAALTDSPAEAEAQAQISAEQVVGRSSRACSRLSVETDTSAFGPGGEVVVTVHCTTDLPRLALFPARVKAWSTSTTPLESHRVFAGASR